MVEIGAIDCGSNSTRLLISTVQNGKLENLHKEHQVTRLSDNIDKTGRISDNSKKRFFNFPFSTLDISNLVEFEPQSIAPISTIQIASYHS